MSSQTNKPNYLNQTKTNKSISQQTHIKQAKSNQSTNKLKSNPKAINIRNPTKQNEYNRKQQKQAKVKT